MVAKVNNICQLWVTIGKNGVEKCAFFLIFLENCLKNTNFARVYQKIDTDEPKAVEMEM